jgi:hypothetical protein
MAERTPDSEPKSLGQAIDEIVGALSAVPEGSRLTAIRAACEHLGIKLEGTVAAPSGHTGTSASEPFPASPSLASPGPDTLQAPSDIRTLREHKAPANGQEMACVMAYYLQRLAPVAERKTEVTAADVEKYFPQANYPLPRVPSQVLIDARAAGYFDPVSRGTYRLNPVGHNLVVHSLPRKQSSGLRKSTTARRSSAPGESRARRKRSRPNK